MTSRLPPVRAPERADPREPLDYVPPLAPAPSPVRTEENGDSWLTDTDRPYGAPERGTRTLPDQLEKAAGRAFAWIDDEVTGVDREYVADIHPGPALLLAEWAANLEAEETS
jgi:hypothetical protein